MMKMALSMMSGTSLDGIDIICGEIEGNFTDIKVNVLYTETYAFEKKLVKKIEAAMLQNHSTSKYLCSLNFELAKAYSKCVFEFCDTHHIDMDSIDFIANHGQTIYHIPDDQGDLVKSSLQLGDGSVLANLTNIPVVSNFRTADMAHGGQGAPLVPYANYVLFKDRENNRILQNIGGIANLTYLTANGSLNDVIAFDNGPGNMMIDYAMKRLFNQPFDINGLTAESGECIQSMFDDIISEPYFSKTPPKTTGREMFGQRYCQRILNKYKDQKPEDIIATLTHITAYTIAKSYQDFCKGYSTKDEIILSGGGANNKTLARLIGHYSQSSSVKTLNDFGYDVDYYEAVAFLILAHETLSGKPSNVPSATGANQRTILGQISPVCR